MGREESEFMKISFYLNKTPYDLSTHIILHICPSCCLLGKIYIYDNWFNKNFIVYYLKWEKAGKEESNDGSCCLRIIVIFYYCFLISEKVEKFMYNNSREGNLGITYFAHA